MSRYPPANQNGALSSCWGQPYRYVSTLMVTNVIQNAREYEFDQKCADGVCEQIKCTETVALDGNYCIA